MSEFIYNSDAELMHAVAENNEAAIATLYDKYSGLVYRMAYQMMPTQAEAEDAVQDIFVRLWRTSGRYDTERAALTTWTVMIARRYLVDRLRRAQVRVKAKVALEEKLEPTAVMDDPGRAIEIKERYTALMGQIEQLPELQQMVVKKAYLGGQTLRQIGIELDRPLGTIKSTLSRALIRLREEVGEESVI